MQTRIMMRGGLVALLVVLVITALVYTTLQASAQGVRIQYDETVEGEITGTDDTDTWIFDGLRGDVVAIRITRMDGSLVPAVTLTDSEKTVLVDLSWPQDGPPDVWVTVTLRTNGTHTLLIQGNNDTTGSYTLNLRLQQPGESAVQDDAIIYGRTVSGEITDAAFRRVWSFRGTQNDVIDINMITTSGDLDGYLTLFTPENNILASADSGGESPQDPALYAIKLPSTGIYSLVVRRTGPASGEGGTTQGAYDLAVNLRSAGSDESNVTPSSLVMGSSTRGRLSIDAPRALFSTEAEGVVALALDLTDLSQVGTISVMTSDRALLGVISGISPLRASVVISQPGPILIEISVDRLAADTVVDFSLTTSLLTTTTQAARALQYNQPRITPGGTISSDAWYFGGRAGDLVDISVKPFTSILNGDVRVFSPGGELLAEVPVRYDVIQPLLLTETGQYEIFVDEVNTTYQISVDRRGMSGLAFNQRLTPDLRGNLIPGSANGVSGELSPGGSDVWLVDIVNPQMWRFEISKTGSDSPAGLAVETPDGEEIALAVTNRISNTAVVQVPISLTGRYRIVVFDPTNNAAHTYTLRGQPTDGGLLQPGTTVKGVLADGQPYDIWQITLLPGASVDLQVDPLVAGSLPVVNVFGADGQILASSRWIESTERVKLTSILATEGGTWQIVIAQPAGAGRFVYRMTADVQIPFDETTLRLTSAGLQSEVFVTEATPNASEKRVSISDLISAPLNSENPHSITLETLARGEITPDKQYEAWSFSANADQMLEFSVVAVDDASDPHITLLDQSGNVLVEDYQKDTKVNTIAHRFVNSGTYIVAVELKEKGRYTLWIQPLPDINERVPVVIPGSAIDYGMTAEGEITQNSDVPLYVFQGRGGDVVDVHVRAISGDLQPRVTLSAVDGDELATSTTDAALTIADLSKYSLPQNGLYQLSVESSRPGAVGRYVLSLDLEKSSTSETIIGGSLETQQIGALGADGARLQRWLLSGRAGERVTVRAELLSSGSPTPFVLQLADSAGNVFAQRDAQIGRGALVLENTLLPRTGVYQVMVSGGQREAGFYRVTLERDPSGISNRERAIRYGETLGHVLTRDNFLDVWTFAGSPGDVVTLSVRPIFGDSALISMQLRTQDGQVIMTSAATENSVGARIEGVTLPANGHYSVLVGNLDNEFDGEAAYELTVQLKSTLSHSMGTVVPYGQTIEGTFYVDDPADTWLFEGQQGDSITITAEGLYPGLLPLLSLVSTDWRVASQYGQVNTLADAQAVNQEPAQINLTLPYDGPYAVVVSDPLRMGGNYQLVITGHTALPLASNPIRPNQTRSGQIGDTDVIDAWIFDGNTNDLVSITMKPESRSLLAPEVRLLGPDGTLLAQSDEEIGGAAQINTYSLPVGGQYVIIATRVFGPDGETEGRYALDLQQTQANPDTVLSTAYGRSERGVLDTDNPVDRWTFSGQRGDTVHLHAESTSGDLDPVLILYDGSGRLLAMADDVQGMDADLFAPLPEDDSYLVDVARYDSLAGTTKGNYLLDIELAYHDDVVSTDHRLTYGDRISGATDAQIRSALWTFAGEQGDIISAKIQFPVDDAPLTLTMRDPAGNVLAAGERDRGDVVIESFSLPSKGDYVLEIRRPEDAKALHSPYTLEVSLLGAVSLHPQAGGTLTPGQSVSGLFSSPEETHSWAFQGQAGDTVFIRLNSLNSLAALGAVLLIPDGSVLASVDAGVEGTAAVILPMDGIYTLLVEEVDETPGTIYRLSLQMLGDAQSVVSTIEPFQNVFGTINDLHLEETWKFDAQSGDALHIRLVSISGDLVPVLMLWGPDGRPLMEGIREYTDQGVQVYLALSAAPASGAYRVEVGREGGAAGSTSGNYRLMLREQQITPAAASAVDVAFEQPVFDLIDGANTKRYAFQGLAGEVVIVTARAEKETSTLALSLEMEDGTLLDTLPLITGPEAGMPALALPDNGRYIVTLASDETTNFVFVIKRQPHDIPSNVTAHELELNRNFIGEITDPAQLTYWTISGQAGDVLNFNIDASGSQLRTHVTLYAPRGYVTNVVQSSDASDVTLGPIRLPDDGIYRLVIGAWPGFTGDPVGRYVVRVERAEVGISGSDGGTVIIGQSVSGGLIPEDAQDVWTFRGTAGETIDIFAEKTRGDDSLTMKLMASDGRILANSQPGTTYLGAEIRAARLPDSGIYQIVVTGDPNGIDGASIEYRLAVMRNQTPLIVSMSNAQGITYGQALQGLLDAKTNMQAWVFFGHAGERVSIQVEPASDGLRVGLYLLTPGGGVLRAETGMLNGAPVAISEVTLPEDGFFGIVVDGQFADSADTTGLYTISLNQLLGGSQFQGVLEGTSTASLTPRSSVHGWAFTPVYSGLYVVQVTPTEGIVPGLSVTAGDGAHYIGTTDSDQGYVETVVQLERDVTYSIFVNSGPTLTDQSFYTIEVAPATVRSGGGDLVSGQSEVGRINQDYIANEWRIMAGAGRLAVEVSIFDKRNFQPVVSVFDANGLLITEAAADESGYVYLDVGIVAAGRYSIVVSGTDVSEMGDYVITAAISQE